ncbi:hypothetical protein CEXT_389191 [Caerostris extrusa]|uniref:Uncharacterized protein n=1 Tax=Caerostris extrusa TaxID=172846 RepID=A0AAV4PK74_CAEEX|nr:hypothetical protein CEXT_389191 [Caerostris extrusa]
MVSQYISLKEPSTQRIWPKASEYFPFVRIRGDMGPTPIVSSRLPLAKSNQLYRVSSGKSETICSSTHRSPWPFIGDPLGGEGEDTL